MPEASLVPLQTSQPPGMMGPEPCPPFITHPGRNRQKERWRPVPRLPFAVSLEDLDRQMAGRRPRERSFFAPESSSCANFPPMDNGCYFYPELNPWVFFSRAFILPEKS